MRKKLKVGKYILDTISIGMYSNPLMILREYIQNSTDSIDEAIKKKVLDKGKERIEIEIDGYRRIITIKDNGLGIESKKAWSILHDLGKSTKRADEFRGFRGIGRLGGIGYCNELRFSTKTKGENIVTISEWDCKKLGKLINERNKALDIDDTVKRVTEFSQYSDSNLKDEHFFIVEMKGMKSLRDILMNVPAIRSYVSQIAPVPFNKSIFKFSNEIDKRVRNVDKSYKTYKIFVNGRQCLKPYKDFVQIGKKCLDQVEDIKFVEFKKNEHLLAFGWLAKLHLLGRINAFEKVDGIRIRKGNMQVGDNRILADFFRERRFNEYLMGEINILNGKLVLNSRRDDFEDNNFKEMFYDCFIKEIGIRMSRKIRKESEKRIKMRKDRRDLEIIRTSKKIIKRGVIASKQKEFIVNELSRIRNNNYEGDSKKFDKLICNIRKSKHILDDTKITKKKKKLLKSILDIIYQKCKDKEIARDIISKIIEKVKE